MTRPAASLGKFCVAMVTAIVLTVGLIPVAGSAAHAASTFDAGNIISDENFYDSDALGADEVQSFLTTKMPRCTIGDAGRKAGSAWGSTRIADHCLRDLVISTPTRSANAYCSTYSGKSSERAADIIARVGKACGISQKVLLIMLQKEQSLVTDSWPTVLQFSRAMGYACPDSGPNNSAECDQTQEGFFQQVYQAAWQFKVYRAFPNNYNYKPFATNTIQWHPNVGCGTSNVYIQNWATAALYIYTPYRPNQAALDAGFGLGDACSTYGNRDFYNLFSEWFGSPLGSVLSPVGTIQSSVPGIKSATIAGYAFDPETPAPISVHYYIGGTYEGAGRWGGSQVADRANEVVRLKYPSYGAAHGFEISIPSLNSQETVCVYAINVGQGATKLLGCPSISPVSGAPIGNFEAFELSGGSAKVKGWALDPDTVGPVVLHAYLGGVYGQGKWLGSYTTGTARADVQKIFPAFGAATGFEFNVLPGKAGESLCLYAIDAQSRSNAFLGCRALATAGPPIGNFESATSAVRAAAIKGWAFDADVTTPISVHVYVDGRWAGAYTADRNRADVARAYPGVSANHGFEIQLSGLEPGSRKVCVYAIDEFGSKNPQLGCRNVNVLTGDPIGSFDGFAQDSTLGSYARGWALDLDTQEPLEVHAYLNSRWYGSFLADKTRPDIGAAFPGFGANHGFEIPVTSTGRLCIYAINQGSGTNNSLLGCGLH